MQIPKSPSSACHGAPCIEKLSSKAHKQTRYLQIGVLEGILFLSYSSLISGCDNGQTRINQITEWCGAEFDGLIVFDECHKAKNLVPEAGVKSTKVGRLVLELQQSLPKARVVYCSATGQSLLRSCKKLLWTSRMMPRSNGTRYQAGNANERPSPMAPPHLRLEIFT